LQRSLPIGKEFTKVSNAEPVNQRFFILKPIW
jgi:hypothetical protein